MKKALIFGVTGQDGSYLSELLLEKGYEVHGVKRRTSWVFTPRLDHIYEGPQDRNRHFILHYGDMTDSSSIIHIIQKVKPDEIYNLAAMSQVRVSFEIPEYCGDVDALGALRILEAIRLLGLEEKTKFYQASTSEMYGLAQEVPQNEKTPFYPRSPYAAAKLYAYWVTVNYREGYNIFACNGILFNHESERREQTFLTRKVTIAAARIKYGLQKTLYLGNLDAKRDWGHARHYVESMWMMLQQDEPDDYVVGSGESHSVREFVEKAFARADINIMWEGEGVDEIGIDRDSGEVVIKIDPRYFRPTEAPHLLSDPSKAMNKLGWDPQKMGFDELVNVMVDHDIGVAQRELHQNTFTAAP